jgi:hypothetical protein
MDELAHLLDRRRAISRTLRAAHLNAESCPCPTCQWGYDVARAALELWDVRLLALVPKHHKQAVKALTY